MARWRQKGRHDGEAAARVISAQVARSRQRLPGSIRRRDAGVLSVTRIELDSGKHPWEGQPMAPGNQSKHAGCSGVVDELALRRAWN